MKRLQIHRRRCGPGFRFTTKNACGAFQKLALPLCDLVGMHIKLLRQLRKRLFALDRGQGHLRLEYRCVVPTWTSAHLLSSTLPS